MYAFRTRPPVNACAEQRACAGVASPRGVLAGDHAAQVRQREARVEGSVDVRVRQ